MVDVAKQPTTSVAATLVLGTAACVLLGALAAGQRRRVVELEKEVERQEALRNGEHAGRVKAEKELRAFVSCRMQTEGGLFFSPIATVHSCFTECVGTPRQGQFAPSTRALLVFDKGSVSPVALDGVEEFSHLWVFWAFHLNTNAKDTRAHTGLRADSRGHTFPAKVAPPFLKRRVGVFSTRTPHRPNPIGVSLCKVDEVNSAERSIKLSGVDLVDGTPVLDIKPYVPDYDCPRDNSRTDAVGGDGNFRVRVADWVGASVKHRREVVWAPDAELQLKEACTERRRRSERTRMRFFKGDHEGAKRAITESLSVDVRSLRKTREAAAAPSCILLFDGLRVEFASTVTSQAPSTPDSASKIIPPFPPAIGNNSNPAGEPSASLGASSGETPGSPPLPQGVAGRSPSLTGVDAGMLVGREGGHGRAGSSFEAPSPVIDTVRVLSVEVGCTHSVEVGGGLSRGA